jgi:SAM-dependent methyltransferase
VGCGPGHLSIQLTRQHGFDVTGLDLDSAMIARARANADRPANGDRRRPALLVGDVAALAFPLSRMTCPPAEPVQFLFNGKSRHAGASRHAPISVSAARRGQTLGPSASRTLAAWPSALTLCQARWM